MDIGYSVEVYKELEAEFRRAAVHRPMRFGRYEADTELAYDVTGMAGPNKGRVQLVVDKFILSPRPDPHGALRRGECMP